MDRKNLGFEGTKVPKDENSQTKEMNNKEIVNNNRKLIADAVKLLLNNSYKLYFAGKQVFKEDI